MSLEIYSAVFWIVAIVSTFLQDKAASNGVKKVASPTTVIKMIPALTAVVFVLLFRPPTLFTILLAAALVFCMFGDVGMEADLVPGIGMFLIAHILYTINFVWHSNIAGLLLIPETLSAICLGLGIVYVIILIQYLKSSGPDVPLFILRAGSVYFFMIISTLSFSLLLWQVSGILLGFLPVIGALFFVISDSFIAINEFHHKLGRHEFYIMPTYYLAIFLLSLGVFVFTF